MSKADCPCCMNPSQIRSMVECRGCGRMICSECAEAGKGYCTDCQK